MFQTIELKKMFNNFQNSNPVAQLTPNGLFYFFYLGMVVS